MEVARIWCSGGRPRIPDVVISTIDDHPSTAGFFGWDVDVEHVTAIDDFAGEGRNHDIVIVGQCDATPTLVAIEAKAAEPFGDPLQVTVTRALARSKKSKVPQRLDLLAQAVRGKPAMVPGSRLSTPRSRGSATSSSRLRLAPSWKPIVGIARKQCCWYIASWSPRRR
jgi:hypothetical protein